VTRVKRNAKGFPLTTKKGREVFGSNSLLIVKPDLTDSNPWQYSAQ